MSRTLVSPATPVTSSLASGDGSPMPTPEVKGPVVAVEKTTPLAPNVHVEPLAINTVVSVLTAKSLVAAGPSARKKSAPTAFVVLTACRELIASVQLIHIDPSASILIA